MEAYISEKDENVLLEADWNREAGEMVEEVIRTQKEVAELLTNHSIATSELQDMKESCEKELEDLQSDAWKLQLYAELERMRSQIELLAPLNQDKCSYSDDDADATAASSLKAASDTGSTLSPMSGSTDTAKDFFQPGEKELHDLDQEIAVINAELAAAKQEMKEMLMLKADLEREVGSIAQLAAKVAHPAISDEQGSFPGPIHEPRDQN